MVEEANYLVACPWPKPHAAIEPVRIMYGLVASSRPGLLLHGERKASEVSDKIDRGGRELRARYVGLERSSLQKETPDILGFFEAHGLSGAGIDFRPFITLCQTVPECDSPVIQQPSAFLRLCDKECDRRNSRGAWYKHSTSGGGAITPPGSGRSVPFGHNSEGEANDVLEELSTKVKLLKDVCFSQCFTKVEYHYWYIGNESAKQFGQMRWVVYPQTHFSG
ncbi:hypothetical protein P691DRAFT_786272 [Macrolepiota fuliginosa MF-IS2]|uniref:Uncharacterized protein n=1 Tax=Macrolepiota fuliginosa MF-IS2 TaxID=1400762 RepID=A0A9P6C814_9AGAR|nr:hypothetical protein P691DRAFT_786272 [Macrolepiota fuliginosa MF-IS2]